MKRLCAAVLLCLTRLTLHAQAAVSAPTSADIQAGLTAQVDVFMQAWEHHDAAAMTATMVPEFVYVSSRGVAPRQGVVGALTHACTLSSYSLSDVRVVSLSPDAATLVYKLHQTSACSGHPDPSVMWNTDTLVRRDGKWLFIMTTSTAAE